MDNEGGIDLYEELQGLIRELDRRGIEYALVGALALAIHGVVRATVDIDLLVMPQDVDSALGVARDRGFSIEALPMTLSSGLMVRRRSMILGEDSLTVDFLVVSDDLRSVWNDRAAVETDRGELWVISREALIQMKALAGREQDLADIRRLRELDG